MNAARLTRTQIKDPEEVTNKMYGRNIDIEVTLSGSLICARVRYPPSTQVSQPRFVFPIRRSKFACISHGEDL